MNAHKTGRKAERAAVSSLRQLGYEIIDKNWRNPRCEIDIVALKDNRLIFFEVKYRRRAEHGNGLDYITEAKQRQMRFCADNYIAFTGWTGDYSLGAIAVSGPEFTVEAILEDI